jgi:hypothetical protein
MKASNHGKLDSGLNGARSAGHSALAVKICLFATFPAERG